MLTKQEILLGKGTRVENSKGTQENCSASWLAVSGFMAMGLVSGWSLANHSNSEYFLVAHASLNHDGCQLEGFREVDGHAVSSFNLSRTLPVGGGGLLVTHSFSGSPVTKQLMQMVTMVPGQGGPFQSACFPRQCFVWQTRRRRTTGAQYITTCLPEITHSFRVDEAMSPERFPEQCHTVKKILFTHEGEMLLGISEMNKKHAGAWLFFF